MDSNTNIDISTALGSIWANGYHSLCGQALRGRFHTIGFHDHPDDLLDYVVEHPEQHLWFGVNGLRDIPATGRGKNSDVAYMKALFADVDWADDTAHKDADLPTEAEVRALVETIKPAPTLIINSGNGLQLYWALLNELDHVEGPLLADGFNRFLESEYGIKNDRTDAASVLRIPGSFNHKTSPPKEVKIEFFEEYAAYSPDWIVDNAWLPAPLPSEAPSVPTATSAPSVPHGGTVADTPIEWVKSNFDSYQALLRLGWQPGPRQGDEEQLTRPGKDSAQGTSATFHHDTGAVNIYTKTLPPQYLNLGRHGQGCITLTPFDVWCVENGFSDAAAASRSIRAMMPQPETQKAPARETEQGPSDQGEEVAMSSDGLNLPDEFWESRPILEQIRQAAHSFRASPDAVLADVLARYATVVPPHIQLPQFGTFDIFTMVRGISGAGKSTASDVAAELLPVSRQDFRFGVNFASGEAMIESFFRWEDEDGNECSQTKKGAVKRQHFKGIHFKVDEGTTLLEKANRAGSIVLGEMCSAWSGKEVGHENADRTRSRSMRARSYRIAIEIGIQDDLGWKFFDEALGHQGIAQRFCILSATDPGLVGARDLPPFPGPLDVPTNFKNTGAIQVVNYPQFVNEILLERSDAIHGGTYAGNPLDTHEILLKLKIAGLLALMDHRFLIDSSDWELAETVWTVHVANRTLLQKRRNENLRDARHTKISLEIDDEERRDMELVRRCRDKALHLIQTGKSLASKNFPTKQREVREQVLEELVAEGLVIHKGDGYSAR